MSDPYANKDPLEIAKQAERDLASQEAKGTSKTSQSDSTADSGIDESATAKFPGSSVQIGGTGAGDNRPIPESEGGSIDPATGQPSRAKEFEGPGGPEEKARIAAQTRPGDDGVREDAR